MLIIKFLPVWATYIFQCSSPFKYKRLWLSHFSLQTKRLWFAQFFSCHVLYIFHRFLSFLSLRRLLALEFCCLYTNLFVVFLDCSLVWTNLHTPTLEKCSICLYRYHLRVLRSTEVWVVIYKMWFARHFLRSIPVPVPHKSQQQQLYYIYF